MGGIVGVYPDHLEYVRWMQSQLLHRGSPVLDHWEIEGCNALYHPDIDPTDRVYRDENRTVVLDGRILNKSELKGNTAEPTADAAVLGKHLDRTGTAGLSAVEGGFAVAIHSSDGVKLYRDALGRQPLYYGFGEEERCFYASEAKALHPWVDEVLTVPPGSVVSETGTVEEDVDEIAQPVHVPEDRGAAVELLREYVERAVDKRLQRTDVAYAFLSGGLDSSIIAAVLAEKVDTLHTFSVGTSDSEDVEYARLMAEHIGSEHHEYLFEEDELLSVLPNVIYYFETFVEDFMRAGIGTYFVSRLAAKTGTNYVFVGEGPDEVLGGYPDIKETVDDPEVFNEATERITETLHEGGGLRLERMTTANKLEYAAPFLDRTVVRYGLEVPPEWKVYGSENTEKWILRAAFEDILPEEIAWRPKDPFATGSGALNVAEQLAEKRSFDEDLTFDHNDPKRPLSEQDALYYDLFQRFYDREKMTELLPRWDPFEERFER